MLNEVLGGISDGGLDLKEALSNLSAEGNNLPVNTFPFGAKTHSIHPDFIGIACTAEASLEDVFDSVERHCRDMERHHFRVEDDKTVIILTDKWDQVNFQQNYEKFFLRYALRDRVLFLFILVNSYGASPIPFLPWNRYRLERLLDRCRKAGGFEEINTLELLLNDPICEYRTITQSKDGEIDEIIYSFNFAERTYSRETHMFHLGTPDGQTDERHRKKGELKLSAISDFSGSVHELKLFSEDSCTEDPQFMEGEGERTQSILTLFDKTFQWGPGLGKFEKIREAADRLVKSLGLRK